MDRQCQSITREGRTGIGSIAKTVWALSWLCCYVGETLLVTSGHKPIQAARGKEQLTASFSEQNNPTNKARPRAGSREQGAERDSIHLRALGSFQSTLTCLTKNHSFQTGTYKNHQESGSSL